VVLTTGVNHNGIFVLSYVTHVIFFSRVKKS
jgi:hypothetical protein